MPERRKSLLDRPEQVDRRFGWAGAIDHEYQRSSSLADVLLGDLAVSILCDPHARQIHEYNTLLE